MSADPAQSDNLSIRKAVTADAGAISSFNQAMALETEGRALIPEVVDAGVLGLLQHPSLGFYVVAASGDRIVACLLVTHEWSDWRNGLLWWIQSVFVETGWRRRGVYRKLYKFVQQLAEADPSVCGFRLYVEKDNAVAQQTYCALGMVETDYRVYEQLKAGFRYFGD